LKLERGRCKPRQFIPHLSIGGILDDKHTFPLLLSMHTTCHAVYILPQIKTDLKGLMILKLKQLKPEDFRYCLSKREERCKRRIYIVG